MKSKPTTLNKLILCTGLFILAGMGVLKAGTDLWTGGAGTANWADSGNWTGANTPPINGDTPTFGAVGAGGATLNMNLPAPNNTNFAGLTFNSTAPAFTLNGNQINSTGGIVDNSTSLETINFGIIFSSTHTLNAVAGGTMAIGGVISGAGGITKAGGGIVDFNGNTPQTFTGGAAVNAGTLTLDFVTGSPGINIINKANTLALGGGTLNLLGTGSIAVSSNLFASTAINSGNSTVSTANSAGAALAAITENPGGTILFVGPATVNSAGNVAANGTITTTTAGGGTLGAIGSFGNGKNGAYATVGLYDWASTDTTLGGAGTAPYTVIGGSQVAGFYQTTGITTAGNYDVNPAGVNTLGNAGGCQTFRFNTSTASNITFTATTAQNIQGILMTPNMGATNANITGGGLEFGRYTSGSVATYGVIWQNDTAAFLNFSSAINGGRQLPQTNGLVQAGPGTVIYGGVNTYESPTYLNGGYSVVTADSGFGLLANGTPVYVNGGTIVGDATFTMDNTGSNKRNIILGNAGGGLSAITGNAMTIDGVVSGTGNLVAGIPASAANGNTAGLLPGSGAGTGNAAMAATGTVILSAANTYSGNTTIASGTLTLGSAGSINSTPQITVANGAVFDVSAVSSYTLGGAQILAGSGVNNGSVTTSSGSAIYAGTDGVYGTNTFNNNLTLVSGSLCYLDLGTVYNGSNDLISVGGTLSLSSTTFHLKAPSTAASLDTTHDYVLMTDASLSGAPNSTPVWDVQPANFANFIVTTSGNSVVLHYSATAPPSGTGTASPASLNRNQNALITVTATAGSNPIGSVVLDASLIGGSSTTPLVRSNTSSLYTNTVTVSATTAPGIYALPATLSDTTTPTPLTAVVNVSLTVVNGQTWAGAGANDNWSTGINWASGVPPVTGDFATFAGTTRLTPSMDSSYNLTGVAFNSTAGSFILGSPSGTLTLTANGITNNSANPETVNTPLALTAAQTFNAASGDLSLGQAIANGGNLLSIDGAHNVTVSGVVSGAGGLTKNGAGTNFLTGNNTYSGNTTVNAGMLEVDTGGAIAGAGVFVPSNVLRINGGSVTSSVASTVGTTASAGTLQVFAGNAYFNAGLTCANADAQFVAITGGNFSSSSFVLNRAQSYATAPTATVPISAVTTSGLYVNGASANVDLGSLSIGINNSSASFRLDAGTVVVTNEVLVSKISAGSTRWSILQVNGGSFTSQDTVNGIVIAQNNAGAACDGEVYLSGGTTAAQLIDFGVNTDAAGGKGFLILNNSANLYLGSGGIVQSNTAGYTSTISLLGGLMGAQADWACTLPMQLSGGTFTFQAADASNVPHNIALSGVLSGGGALTKTGNGTLTLSAVDTYSGATTISGGTLALTVDGVTSAVGSINNSSTITVGTTTTNATFDVSGISGSGGFTLGNGKTIAGIGTVNGTFAAMDGSTISPAGNGAEGTLNFATGLAAQNMTIKMDLTSDPTGVSQTNDQININGDFTSTGLNNIVVTPVGSLGLGTYKLIKYTGAFNGGLSTLSCVAGTLTNPPGEIDLIVTSVRPVANLIWRGDGAGNAWDTGISSTWLNGASLDKFYTGDTNTFDDSSVNFTVNISGIVTPAPGTVVTVNATHDYTFNAGGDITGGTGLTKTNAGNLTILGDNDYTGVTTINGGTITAADLENGGVSSSIGAANNSATNMVLNGGKLEYTGGNKTIDRSVTLSTNGGTLGVVSGTTLTLSGTLTGAGSLTKVDNGQITLNGANNYAGVTVITDGTIRGNPASAISTNTLTLAGTASSGNTATFQFAGDSQVLSDVLNIVDVNNYLANNGNDTVGSITGGGTVNLNGNSGNTLTLQSADTTGFTGTFLVNTLPTLRFLPSSGSTLNASNATFNLGTGSGQLNNRNGGSFFIGALAGGSSTTVRGGSSDTPPATTYTIGGKNLDSDFSGVIANGAAGNNPKVNIVKVGLGRQTFSGANTYNGSTTVSNGVLALGDGVTDGSINSSPAIDVTAGAALDVSLRSDQTLTLNNGQTLSGVGTINGNVTANSGSTISPADTAATIGLLTITNGLSLQSGSSVAMDVNTSTGTNDVILVQGPAGITYGGTLKINLIGGSYTNGQSFKLFKSTALLYAGTFDGGISPATPGPGLIWDTSSLTVNGRLKVTTPARPAFSSIDFSGLRSSGSIVFSATNGTAGAPVQVLTTTNLLSPWVTNTSTSFDGSGDITGFTITVNPTLPQQFIRLQE